MSAKHFNLLFVETLGSRYFVDKLVLFVRQPCCLDIWLTEYYRCLIDAKRGSNCLFRFRGRAASRSPTSVPLKWFRASSRRWTSCTTRGFDSRGVVGLFDKLVKRNDRPR